MVLKTKVIFLAVLCMAVQVIADDGVYACSLLPGFELLLGEVFGVIDHD